ncbi:hypothetical protein BAUCODRAFT_331102 [Baudoinia panamericana UAMH 10762]|uniref:Uncharacterized protein n=1 Tax=Baudoinia panamericana (strain UAMH 10762) TaxID=717646 RepID=M2MXB9_BAUPA|nr:uncharacterized protein BAUCODRAFT_331102 [Baudoinia panamericana UAMH 10762]EMC90900.1 hypothetical protein BAUCODRAFT_331102 [Baudoinia panamericana UAMH 10762]
MGPTSSGPSHSANVLIAPTSKRCRSRLYSEERVQDDEGSRLRRSHSYFLPLTGIGHQMLATRLSMLHFSFMLAIHASAQCTCSKLRNIDHS